jgi:hypothetical protein
MTEIETMVANVVTSSEAQKIKPFTFNGIWFGPAVFQNIKNLMDEGVIKAEYDESKLGLAEYDYGNNTLYLGFTQATELTQKALVIHEVVHAVYDMVKLKMSVATSESLAYIVQCQYAKANNPNPNKRLEGTTPARDYVFKLAWIIAGKILAGNSPTAEECNNMREAVSKHPLYMSKSAADAGFNG